MFVRPSSVVPPSVCPYVLPSFARPIARSLARQSAPSFFLGRRSAVRNAISGQRTPGFPSSKEPVSETLSFFHFPEEPNEKTSYGRQAFIHAHEMVDADIRGGGGNNRQSGLHTTKSALLQLEGKRFRIPRGELDRLKAAYDADEVVCDLHQPKASAEDGCFSKQQ